MYFWFILSNNLSVDKPLLQFHVGTPNAQNFINTFKHIYYSKAVHFSLIQEIKTKYFLDSNHIEKGKMRGLECLYQRTIIQVYNIYPASKTDWASDGSKET